LAQLGFLYPQTAIPDREAGHHNIAWQLCGDGRFRTKYGSIGDLLIEIERWPGDVILSSEDLECAAGRFGDLITELRQRALDISIIVYLRDQVSYTRSLYFELIRHGYDRGLNDFLAAVIEKRVVRWRSWVFTFDYRLLIEQLMPFGAVIVRPYRPTENAVGDLLSIFELTPVQIGANTELRANKQEPVSTTFAAFCRNLTGGRFDPNRAAARSALSRIFDTGDVNISLPSREKLSAALAESNRWLDDHYSLAIAYSPNHLPDSPAATIDLETLFCPGSVEFLERHSGGNEGDVLQALRNAKDMR
jgi:hypothetical protein